MSNDVEYPGYRIPSLVQYCQRVASNHVERICSLGDGLRYEIIEPVLENCGAETLARLEEESPYIVDRTSELWKRLCFRTYPLLAERYQSDLIEAPNSWRDSFYHLRDLEARRLHAASERLRSSRLEAEERKKEAQIKITDKVPPAKRSRGWSFAPQPKTLIQKTRTSAARVHKGIYGAGGPAMPPIKSYRTPTAISIARPPTSSSSTAGSRVTVTAVTVRRNPTAAAGPASVSAPAASSTLPSARPNHRAASPGTLKPVASDPTLPIQGEARVTAKSPAKKDPMAALFIPKHRAYSQLANSSRP